MKGVEEMYKTAHSHHYNIMTVPELPLRDLLEVVEQIYTRAYPYHALRDRRLIDAVIDREGLIYGWLETTRYARKWTQSVYICNLPKLINYLKQRTESSAHLKLDALAVRLPLQYGDGCIADSNMAAEFEQSAE